MQKAKRARPSQIRKVDKVWNFMLKFAWLFSFHRQFLKTINFSSHIGHHAHKMACELREGGNRNPFAHDELLKWNSFAIKQNWVIYRFASRNFGEGQKFAESIFSSNKSLKLNVYLITSESKVFFKDGRLGGFINQLEALCYLN